MNKVLLIGRLTKDPELRYTQSGTAVASFTLAVNRRFSNQSGEREADFINCVAWQKSAEFVANYFRKGQQMALEGRLQVRSYDGNDGQRRWVTEVVAEQIEFVGSKNENGSGRQDYQNNNASAGSSLGLGEEIVFDDNDLPF
ncbi:MAG: single-stranded DNA-binding protein [Peptococcaceae bacterium]|jgi:single-strand DNA-binding protein|nr:single-stranded DNA-binding protein [Peptococcaceae bacterium]MBQ2005041.1 single-stranded DNA-binding protein [Peptococcaceae bacterium]MBQ2120137.1 single-stranded DNA-binding protein [Peptococcaceae bacterium]MBQ2369434.1 single-stranded DNA-binding protein [Peptococcaceae bacterium]MBQ5615799.1 single-stranded DNA-binding protein [Peptococcaceae bacterium]